VQAGEIDVTSRVIPEEVPVAFVYNGSTHAVMMATPHDLEDFAIGFSLTEGQIDKVSDIESLEVVPQSSGIELRMWMSPTAGHRMAVRRRAMLGPTGCGLCGVDSLEQALPQLGKVDSSFSVQASDLEVAMSTLTSLQAFNAQSRAVHAAGFWTPEGTMHVREDVGRHNALDKLAGGLTKAGRSASAGVVLLTSRVSVELVQKTARMECPILAAVSAPTALAVRTAEAAGITLIALVRGQSLEIFTHPHRITRTPPPPDPHGQIEVSPCCVPAN
jgi:FdhD protein